MTPMTPMTPMTLVALGTLVAFVVQDAFRTRRLPHRDHARAGPAKGRVVTTRAPSTAVADSVTMLRRNVMHMLRHPSMTISSATIPVAMLLLFVHVFGGALGTGLGTGTDYVDYVAPGIILIAATSGCMAVSVSVCVDMTEGIVNRFRTMAISRGSILTGHVVGGAVQTLVSLALVVGVTLLTGFRPTAGPGEWLAVVGLLLLLVLALAWLATAFGLVTKNVGAASNAVFPIRFLPVLGSAIVPSDSMPAGVRWFAEYQPFTPVVETLRGLLTGTPIGNSGAIAVAWCVGIGVTGYLWSRRAFARTG